MTYPQYEKKHLGEALISAKEVNKYTCIKNYDFPENYILTYQKEPLSFFKSKYKHKYKKIKITRHLCIYKLKNIGLVLLNEVGAPHAAMIFEELIAFGGKRFLNIGLAGGLKKEGFFLCSKALRDEGTSHHYLPHGKFIFPDKGLTNSFGKILKEKKIKFFYAPTWTIDAVFRETKAEIEHYKRLGICTVDMESSALFAIAKVKKVKIASAFIVSDLLGSKWTPKFNEAKIKLNKLLSAAIACLKNEI